MSMSLATSETYMLVGLITAIIVLIFVVTIIDIFKRKNVPLDDEEIIVNEPQNDKEVEEIKYVVYDAELEKTKAREELKNLKETLTKEKRDKEVEMIEEIVHEDKKEGQAVEKVEVPKEETVQVEKTEVKKNKIETFSSIGITNGESDAVSSFKSPVVVEEIKEAKNEEEEMEIISIDDDAKPFLESVTEEISIALIKEKALEQEKHEEANAKEDLQVILNESIDDVINKYESEQEEKAIISVSELQEKGNAMYEANEVVQYEEEKDMPISLDELYQRRENTNPTVVEEVISEETPKIVVAPMNVNDLPPISDEKIFTSSPVISPVFGVSESKESLLLEQTANLEKLNEEIKKTNEFLMTLKELQKNLK